MINENKPKKETRDRDISYIIDEKLHNLKKDIGNKDIKKNMLLQSFVKDTTNESIIEDHKLPTDIYKLEKLLIRDLKDNDKQLYKKIIPQSDDEFKKDENNSLLNVE